MNQIMSTTSAIRAEDLSATKRWVMFVAIMLPYVFYAFVWNTENFLRPYMAQSLGLSKPQVASFYTFQGAGALLGALLIPQLSDLWSRRGVYAFVALGIGISSLAIVFVDSYQTAIAQRFAMGIFLGGVFGCAVSLYIGYFPPTMRGLLAGMVQLTYNGGDALLSWIGRHYDATNWQQVLVIGGIGAITASLIVMMILPRDSQIITWGEIDKVNPARGRRLPIAELFSEGRSSITLRLALMCGLNFFAFQSFNGWTTTLLREQHQMTPDLVGKLMTLMHVGSMTGALFWGLIGDRFGRRANAAGFLVAAALILLYLNIQPSFIGYAVIGFAYGFCFVSMGVWGPYFAELYPPHLRATAASIFNWGRIVSLVGSLLSGAIADNYGLTSAMAIGAFMFLLAALVWLSLPETLEKQRSAVF
ncbi:MAG: MFS transporter [Betaproteobacteria bacterium]|nr:MFS transporter [Betaproteobacteria bacterium]